jgi:hypothetical protein
MTLDPQPQTFSTHAGRQSLLAHGTSAFWVVSKTTVSAIPGGVCIVPNVGYFIHVLPSPFHNIR